jgi:hypothetical protein
MKLSRLVVLGIAAAILGCGEVEEAQNTSVADESEPLESTEQALGCTNYTTKLVAIPACCSINGHLYQKKRKYMCMYNQWTLMETVCNWTTFCYYK